MLYALARGNRTVKRKGGQYMGMGYPHKMDMQRDELHMEGNKVIYHLWGHPIATLDVVSHVLNVSDCGYRTFTTKERINGLLPSGKIYQKDFVWYVYDPKKKKDIVWPGKAEFKVPVKMRG